MYFIACPPEVVRLIAECAWRSLLFFGCCRWTKCIGELPKARKVLWSQGHERDDTTDRWTATVRAACISSCSQRHAVSAHERLRQVFLHCVKAVLALGVAFSLEEELDLARATPSPSAVPR